MIVYHSIQEQQDLFQLWMRDDIYILSNRADVTMDASAGKFCFLGDLQEDKLKHNIVCMESLTGTVLWNKESSVHETLSISPDGIFVAYSSPASVRKYDFQTGDLIWHKKLPGSGTKFLYLVDHQVQVVTSTHTDTLSILDMDGNVLKTLRNQQAILISTSDETYVSLTGIRAINTNTGDIIWDYIDHGLGFVPFFTQDKVFLRDGDFFGTAYALERETGKLLWEVDKIVGNIAYSPDKQRVYALSEDGSLLAIDENSGHENAIARFSNTPFLFIKDGEAQAYQLAFDKEEKVLIVALGDGNQLFAFMEK
jgi:outer membrane protein assembly factor BamB